MEQAQIARLESQVDMLETELSYLDNLLVECGFPEGIKTLKETAIELIAESSGSLEISQRSPLLD